MPLIKDGELGRGVQDQISMDWPSYMPLELEEEPFAAC